MSTGTCQWRMCTSELLNTKWVKGQTARYRSGTLRGGAMQKSHLFRHLLESDLNKSTKRIHYLSRFCFSLVWNSVMSTFVAHKSACATMPLQLWGAVMRGSQTCGGLTKTHQERTQTSSVNNLESLISSCDFKVLWFHRHPTLMWSLPVSHPWQLCSGPFHCHFQCGKDEKLFSFSLCATLRSQENSLTMVSSIASFLLIAVIFLCRTLCCSSGISCQNEAGEPVDWWVDWRYFKVFEISPVFFFFFYLHLLKRRFLNCVFFLFFFFLWINVIFFFLKNLIFFCFTEGLSSTNCPDIRLARSVVGWITCTWTRRSGAGRWVNSWWTPVKELLVIPWTSSIRDRPTR